MNDRLAWFVEWKVRSRDIDSGATKDGETFVTQPWNMDGTRGDVEAAVLKAIRDKAQDYINTF